MYEDRPSNRARNTRRQRGRRAEQAVDDDSDDEESFLEGLDPLPNQPVTHRGRINQGRLPLAVLEPDQLLSRRMERARGTTRGVNRRLTYPATSRLPERWRVP